MEIKIAEATTWIGVYVTWGKEFGMIDDIHPNDGEGIVYLGLVYGSPNEWVGRLVKAEDVARCTYPDDVAKAKKSAKTYFENEYKSVRRALVAEQAIDPKKRMDGMAERLSDRLGFLAAWMSRI